MIRFLNPYFKTATQTKVAQHKPAIDAWMKLQVGDRVITIAQLKTAFPAIAADLNRVTVNQLMEEIGAVAENPDDPEL